MTRRVVGLTRALVGFAVLFAVTAGAALAADPTDTTFGTNGIAEIEARVTPPEDLGQVGGIADLDATRGGKTLAAIYPIARRGHYFAAARIGRDGALDRSFGRNGFTPYVNVAYRKGENGGVLQGEAVAGLQDGKVLVAGYYENTGAFAPALARFTAKGGLDPSFGRGGKVVPRPSFQGRPVETEGGGERLHDVALEPDGTIVGVGDVVAAPHGRPGAGPRRDAALVIAYPTRREDRPRLRPPRPPPDHAAPQRTLQRLHRLHRGQGAPLGKAPGLRLPPPALRPLPAHRRRPDRPRLRRRRQGRLREAGRAGDQVHVLLRRPFCRRPPGPHRHLRPALPGRP
ncbi:MAG TPA: delta-60 repeat domain-containing protein [Solirubrobacterales bacterium]|nr:delta-60 repeat domain-containing protein [Solirubrobacterales bacterium]